MPYVLLRMLLLPMLLLAAAPARAAEADTLAWLRQLNSPRPTERFSALEELAKYWLWSEPVRAYDYARQLQAEAREADSLPRLAQAHSILGVLHDIQNDFAPALEHFQEALHLRQQLGLTAETAASWNNLGLVYNSTRRYADAHRAYRNAIALAQKARRPGLESQAWNNLGSMWLHRSNTDSALWCYRKSLDIKLRNALTKELPASWNNMGNLFVETSRLDSAMVYFEKAYASLDTLNDRFGQGLYLTNMAVTALRQADAPRAARLCARALPLLHQTQNMSSLDDAYALQRDIAERAGDWRTALAWADSLSLLREQASGLETERKLAQAETRLELTRKDQQITLLEQQRSLANLRTWAFGGAGLAVALAVALVLNRRRERMRRQKLLAEQQAQLAATERDLAHERLRIAELEAETLAQRLEQQHQHLRQMADALLLKTELLEDLQQRLLETDTTPDRQSLRQLAGHIGQSLHLDRDRQEFEAYLQQLEEGFFERLAQRWPDLNEQELRLCSLLRRNLASKEIAALLNLSPKSVDTYRYNLRKKFNLPAQHSLTDYLAAV